MCVKRRPPTRKAISPKLWLLCGVTLTRHFNDDGVLMITIGNLKKVNVPFKLLKLSFKHLEGI